MTVSDRVPLFLLLLYRMIINDTALDVGVASVNVRRRHVDDEIIVVRKRRSKRNVTHVRYYFPFFKRAFARSRDAEADLNTGRCKRRVASSVSVDDLIKSTAIERLLAAIFSSARFTLPPPRSRPSHTWACEIRSARKRGRTPTHRAAANESQNFAPTTTTTTKSYIHIRYRISPR